MRREDDEVSYEGTHENKYIALHLLFHIEVSFFFLILRLVVFASLTLVKCTHDGPKRKDTMNRQRQQRQAYRVIVRDRVTTLILSRREFVYIGGLVLWIIGFTYAHAHRSVVIVVSATAKM